MAGKRKRPAAAKSRFKVYRPEPKPSVPDVTPNETRRKLYRPQPKPETREPETATGSRVRRFTIYQAKAEPQPTKPNGSCWIEVDGWWMCEYGCKTFKVKEAPNGVADNDYHAYDCRYWWEAGIEETPF